MKKIILALLMGCLFIGVNAYAAGDLQVNGALGIGKTPPTNYKADLLTTNVRGLKVTATMNANGAVVDDSIHGMTLKSEVAGTASGYGTGINLITNVASSAANVAAAYGGVFVVSLSSSAAGSTTVAETDAGRFDTLINAGDHNYTVTQGYGFNLNLSDNRSSGNGSLNFTNYKGIYIQNPTSTNGALSIGTLSGIWINQQSLATTKYGIVLDGNGNGADIVFGNNQEARIYSAQETQNNLAAVGIWVKDSTGATTQISPHDPVTGEWIFYSKNINTGRTVRVNMEQLVKAVEKITGEKFMIETIEEIK